MNGIAPQFFLPMAQLAGVGFFAENINLLLVLGGCVLLGLSAGVLGCFAYLRKRSLLGDALAHAALPGVCMAFILTGTKDPLVILIGATVSCWIGALTIDFLVKYTRVKEDSALGMVLSVFFGIGILMLTHIQQSGAAAQSGLDKFLFGQAAALVDRDVWTLGILSVLMLGAVGLAYKEFKLVSFDPGFAHSIGLRVSAVELAMATMIVLAVAIGLQAVGVVLMAAMLVTPAAAARYWTDRLGVMLAIAGTFGAVSGALGTATSYLSPRMPTGPWMVVSVSTLFLVSLTAAPRRGVVARVRRLLRTRRKTAAENILRTMYRQTEERGARDVAISSGDLLRYRPMSSSMLERTLDRLAHAELVTEVGSGKFALTPQGFERAARLTRLHRLWELYLTRKVEIAPDHVHDDAEEIEHILTPELEARLIEILERPERDPHLRDIPEAGADESALAEARQ